MSRKFSQIPECRLVVRDCKPVDLRMHADDGPPQIARWLVELFRVDAGLGVSVKIGGVHRFKEQIDNVFWEAVDFREAVDVTAVIEMQVLYLIGVQNIFMIRILRDLTVCLVRTLKVTTDLGQEKAAGKNPGERISYGVLIRRIKAFGRQLVNQTNELKSWIIFRIQ